MLQAGRALDSYVKKSVFASVGTSIKVMTGLKVLPIQFPNQ